MCQNGPVLLFILFMSALTKVYWRLEKLGQKACPFLVKHYIIIAALMLIITKKNLA